MGTSVAVLRRLTNRPERNALDGLRDRGSHVGVKSFKRVDHERVVHRAAALGDNSQRIAVR